MRMKWMKAGNKQAVFLLHHCMDGRLRQMEEIDS